MKTYRPVSVPTRAGDGKRSRSHEIRIVCDHAAGLAAVAAIEIDSQPLGGAGSLAIWDSSAWLSQHKLGAKTPQRSNCVGRVQHPYSVIRPPSDEPAMPSSVELETLPQCVLGGSRIGRSSPALRRQQVLRDALCRLVARWGTRGHRREGGQHGWERLRDRHLG